MHRFRALLAALALPLLAAAPASSVVIQTVLLGDTPDYNPADGICDADELNTLEVDPDPADDDVVPVGQCTLRAAVQTANLLPGPDTIKLRATFYVLSLVGPGEDAAATGDLDITSDITIDGAGYQLSLLDGKRLKDRIFDVRPGGSLTLNKTGLLYGKTAKEDFDPGPPGEISGGCLRNAGTSSLDEVFFFQCASSDDGGCMSVIDGTATVTDSIFASCRAKNEGGCVDVVAPGSATFTRVTGGACRAGTGGGVASRGALSLLHATFTLNKAKLGGGVAVLGDSTATIDRSTISSNGSSNLLSQTTGVVTVTSSIVANAKTDCVGPVSSGGGNLESAVSCAFDGPNDQQSQDPLLQALGFSGVIPVVAIAENSPAIDHGLDPVDICEDRDVRGLLRVVGASGGPAIADAGAFEFNAATDQVKIISPADEHDTAQVGVAYSYNVAVGAEDTDTEVNRGPCLVFALDVAPTGMTIDPASGLISWTPAAGQEGNRPVTVRFDDEAGMTDTQAFVIVVAP